MHVALEYGRACANLFCNLIRHAFEYESRVLVAFLRAPADLFAVVRTKVAKKPALGVELSQEFGGRKLFPLHEP